MKDTTLTMTHTQLQYNLVSQCKKLDVKFSTVPTNSKVQAGILRNTRGRQRSATLLDSNGTLDLLAKDVKKLVQGIQDLRHLGIEDLVLPLPKIVVVGDQSTGKSSLIEGIRCVPPVTIAFNEQGANVTYQRD